MTLDEAISLMSEYYKDGNLFISTGTSNYTYYLDYFKGSRRITLDGDFREDELEAISIIMRSNNK